VVTRAIAGFHPTVYVGPLIIGDATLVLDPQPATHRPIAIGAHATSIEIRVAPASTRHVMFRSAGPDGSFESDVADRGTGKVVARCAGHLFLVPQNRNDIPMRSSGTCGRPSASSVGVAIPHQRSVNYDGPTVGQSPSIRLTSPMQDSGLTSGLVVFCY